MFFWYCPLSLTRIHSTARAPGPKVTRIAPHTKNKPPLHKSFCVKKNERAPFLLCTDYFPFPDAQGLLYTIRREFVLLHLSKAMAVRLLSS